MPSGSQNMDSVPEPPSGGLAAARLALAAFVVGVAGHLVVLSGAVSHDSETGVRLVLGAVATLAWIGSMLRREGRVPALAGAIGACLCLFGAKGALLAVGLWSLYCVPSLLRVLFGV